MLKSMFLGSVTKAKAPMFVYLKIIFSLFLISASSVVFAHDAALDGSGFMAGFSHPVLGFDHFLAMISVGIISAQIGGKAIWTIPATFVGFMVLGNIAGMAGVDIPFVEITIATSVVLLGITIALPKNIPTAYITFGVAFFGFFHGYAHGVEIPNSSDPLAYAIGFVIGTSLIHLLGVGFGLIAEKTPASRNFLRHIGSAIAGIGVYLLVEYIPLISTLIDLQ